MLEVFEGLSAEEHQLMYDAFPLVTVLISGADGEIEEDEIEWAEKTAHIRSYHEKGFVQDFYKKLDETFSEKVKEFREIYEGDPESRNEAISAELAKLNKILPNLHYGFAQAYYEGLKSFAKHVAKASGGFLGMMSINDQESEWIDLPMIKKF